MDIHSDEEPSPPIFKLFTPRTASSKENGTINKTTENVTTALPSSQLNNNDFDDCSQLPDGLKKCVSAELIGKPLDDPFYGNKETFIVINKNHQLYRFSSTNALGIFSPTSTIRSNLIKILTHPYYAVFMVLVILAFCIVNATVQPTDFDIRYFLIVFLLEFLLKIASHGLLLSPFSYLRNGWNLLDVVLNILLLCGTFYLAELRILTIISYSLNLRRTIRLYWSSCKILTDLIIYMGLMMVILSTVLHHLYMGTLTQACVKDGDIFKLNNEVRLCGNISGAQSCPDSYVCMQEKTSNPDFGYTNFDNIFGSFLSTFRLITRDFWENLLHFVLATSGSSHILLFIGIIFIISYQVLSLIWGQIAISYNCIRLQRWEQNLIADDAHAEDTTSQDTKNDNDAGCWSKYQRIFFFIIYNPYVVLVVIICIILNTLCMALDHHNMDSSLDSFLRVANYTFVVIFVIEAILKLLALGVVRYFKDEWNTFDFVVTVLGAVELVLEGVQGLSVFRSFRLLRPLRLGKIVPAFDLILTRMQHMFSVVSGQTVLFFMGIYIFSVFGCRQFGQDFVDFKYDEADTDAPPLWRFTDIMHSFMVVFRAQCGEWIETMFLCLQVASNSTICIIYYFLLVTISSFQIMHMFTALLFTNDDSTAISTKKTQKSLRKTNKPKEKFQLQPFLREKLLEPSVKRIYDEYRPSTKDLEASGENPSTQMVTKATVEDDLDEAINNSDTSIPIGTTNNVQEFALKNKKNNYFQHCVVTLSVIAASVTLAAGHDTEAGSNRVLEVITFYVELLFVGLLSIELMTKLVTRGWKSCVTDFWYWLDLFNVVIAVLGIFMQNDVLEVLTSLRILSLISRFHGLNVITNAILKQMWFLINTLVVCLAFWLIFAIMGVQLFAGKFSMCNDDEGNKMDSVKNQTECYDLGDRFSWETKPSSMNFDDVIDSYYSLLQVSTFKGWITIIKNAVDSTDISTTPQNEVNIYMFFYFVIFVACGVFVCVNVIVGMLVQHMIHFGSLSELLDQSKASSAKSNETLDKNETPDSNPSNSKFVDFVRSRKFEMIAFGSYMLYILLLMGETLNSSVLTNIVVSYVELGLSILLVIEVILRACAYRKEFFVNSWNRYDVVVIIFTITSYIMMDLVEKYVISVSLFRVIRIFRFNGLMSSFSKTLQRCGTIIARTWKPVSMLYALQFLTVCVYAIIGMVLYKDKKIVFGSVDIVNFATFGQSLILMIQISTAAGWDGVLEQISEDNRSVATVYLLSFLYISFTILLNVMLVIAFEFYKEVTAIDDARSQLQPDDLNDFNEKWKQFAQNEQKYVPKNRLKDFFNSLEESSSLRPGEYDEKEFALLGVNARTDDNYSRSALLIALNRIRLNKQQ